MPRNSRAAALRSRGSVIAHGFSPKSPSSTANEAEDPKERQEMKAKLKAKENAIVRFAPCCDTRCMQRRRLAASRNAPQ